MKLKHRHQSTSYRPDETETSTSSHPIKKTPGVSVQPIKTPWCVSPPIISHLCYILWTEPMCMAHSHRHISFAHTIVMAGTGIWSQNNTTWRDRDEFYYSSPPCWYRWSTNAAKVYKHANDTLWIWVLSNVETWREVVLWTQQQSMSSEMWRNMDQVWTRRWTFNGSQ